MTIWTLLVLVIIVLLFLVWRVERHGQSIRAIRAMLNKHNSDLDDIPQMLRDIQSSLRLGVDLNDSDVLNALGHIYDKLIDLKQDIERLNGKIDIDRN